MNFEIPTADPSELWGEVRLRFQHLHYVGYSKTVSPFERRFVKKVKDLTLGVSKS